MNADSYAGFTEILSSVRECMERALNAGYADAGRLQSLLDSVLELHERAYGECPEHRDQIRDSCAWWVRYGISLRLQLGDRAADAVAQMLEAPGVRNDSSGDVTDTASSSTSPVLATNTCDEFSAGIEPLASDTQVGSVGAPSVSLRLYAQLSERGPVYLPPRVVSTEGDVSRLAPAVFDDLRQRGLIAEESGDVVCFGGSLTAKIEPHRRIPGLFWFESTRSVHVHNRTLREQRHHVITAGQFPGSLDASRPISYVHSIGVRREGGWEEYLPHDFLETDGSKLSFEDGGCYLVFPVPLGPSETARVLVRTVRTGPLSDGGCSEKFFTEHRVGDGFRYLFVARPWRGVFVRPNPMRNDFTHTYIERGGPEHAAAVKARFARPLRIGDGVTLSVRFGM